MQVLDSVCLLELKCIQISRLARGPTKYIAVLYKNYARHRLFNGPHCTEIQNISCSWLKEILDACLPLLPWAEAKRAANGLATTGLGAGGGDGLHSRWLDPLDAPRPELENGLRLEPDLSGCSSDLLVARVSRLSVGRSCACARAANEPRD